MRFRLLTYPVGSRGNERGMTLVELMVAMIIGLGVTLAVTSLLIAGENHKRTTTSTNDAEQTELTSSMHSMGLCAVPDLVRAIRIWYRPGVLGCRLNAGSTGALLPRHLHFRCLSVPLFSLAQRIICV